MIAIIARLQLYPPLATLIKNREFLIENNYHSGLPGFQLNFALAISYLQQPDR